MEIKKKECFIRSFLDFICSHFFLLRLRSIVCVIGKIMEICPQSHRRPVDYHRPSVILLKKTICVDHRENCKCCCCCDGQSKLFKYIQPDVPKSFAPIRTYWRTPDPIERYTTYNRSYWHKEPTFSRVKPFKHKASLTVGDGSIADETTHKVSYLGNWYLDQPKVHPIRCDKQWLGRGPMLNMTTNKCDYTWKLVPKPKAVKNRPNLCCPTTKLSSDTTYNLSYYKSDGRTPITSFKPISKYMKGIVPVDDCTTYKLSYWPNELPSTKNNSPWKKYIKYHSPRTKLDDYTTYRLSYLPNKQSIRKPFIMRPSKNILNADYYSDDKTTYNLSYHGCGCARRLPITPLSSTQLSACPLSHDTIHRLSYLGNWGVIPENCVLPCSKTWAGKGPIQNLTTQKYDFTWKCGIPVLAFPPKDNLETSHQPLGGCTIQRLSYFGHDLKHLSRLKSFKPRRTWQSFDNPMENETTMSLSYQPVDQSSIRRTKTCTAKSLCEKPLLLASDNTTYNLSYLAPGKVEKLVEHD
ncbi:uncharacterized protein LOC135161500 isoform X2 [Diachasmimorpha longicaudata]|uniref:uncharacterized protein LOC135161500 isoform X2 n=1 Tax=Diachasmimorpha longicaudata TaxID=58733 RepID=UPI0030B8A024